MRIYPVSMNNNKSQNTPKFEGVKPSVRLPEGVKNIAMPTVVALAMLVPSSNLKAKSLEENVDVVEQVSKRDKEQNLPYYIQKESVQYSKKFEMDGKGYTMYYTDYCQNFTDRKKAVLEVFFVPEDFKLYKNGASELNAPPKLEELIYHKFDGEGENFVSAVVSEATCEEDGSNYQQIFREIILPEKIGKKLLDLYNGKTKYRLVKGVDTYTETSSKSLMKPIVQRGRTVLKLDK